MDELDEGEGRVHRQQPLDDLFPVVVVTDADAPPDRLVSTNGLRNVVDDRYACEGRFVPVFVDQCDDFAPRAACDIGDHTRVFARTEQDDLRATVCHGRDSHIKPAMQAHEPPRSGATWRPNCTERP
jgi:hypothetical protein